MERNTLYYGDNLDVLRRYIEDESVDLIYLDPPFKSGQDYNILFAEQDGSRSAAQIKAFEDTWRWDEVAARAYADAVDAGGRVSQALQAFRVFLGESEMMAYLAMMAPRLVEMHRALKSSGSLYLHCDPAASHYLKMLLDAVFGPQYFRNEIVWKRFNFHADAKRFGRITDRILYYAKSKTCFFNRINAAFSKTYVESKFTYKDLDGRRYRLSDLNPPGGRGPVYEFHGVTKAWRFTEEKMQKYEAEGRIYTKSKVAQLKRYLDQLPGQAVHELWTDVPPINPQAKERLGYPTQKPEALLERIIEASSKEGDMILDPFCGCGTSIVAAQKLRRHWIGIDITHLATNLLKHRLADTFNIFPKRDYILVGEPEDLSGAAELAREDPYQFQYWILGFVGARPTDPKRGADRGIDGRRYFEGGKYQAIFSVKAGHVSVRDIRDLRGVIEREKATVGALLTLQPPTSVMRKEAAAAGMCDWHGVKYPRLQILTAEELFAGKTLQIHAIMADTTYRRPKRILRKYRHDSIFAQEEPTSTQSKADEE